MLSLFICVSQSSAQEGQKLEQKEETVNTDITIYRWVFSNAISIPNQRTGAVSRVAAEADGDITLWFKSGSDWKSVVIPTGNQSKEIHYEGPSELQFYTRTGESGSDADFKKAAVLDVPLDAKSIGALMFKKGESIRFYAMNISPDKLPKGKIAVMNMTRHNAAISVSGDAKMLKSGAYMVFSPKSKAENTIKLGIAKFFEKKWIPVYDNNIFVSPQKRNIVLIYDTNNDKTPKFSVQMLSF